MGLRLIREMCRRRHIRPRHARYVSKRRVKRAAKAFDERVTSWQRVELRLGGAKRPTDLAASVDKARSLRSINENLEAILDVLRFAFGLPPLDDDPPPTPPRSPSPGDSDKGSDPGGLRSPLPSSASGDTDISTTDDEDNDDEDGGGRTRLERGLSPGADDDTPDGHGYEHDNDLYDITDDEAEEEELNGRGGGLPDQRTLGVGEEEDEIEKEEGQEPLQLSVLRRSSACCTLCST